MFSTSSSSPSPEAARVTSLANYLDELLNLTPDEFIKDPAVIRLVEAGTPSDTIADVAHEVGADLTILGTHEYGTVHTQLIGSTTDQLLARTSTSILALKL